MASSPAAPSISIRIKEMHEQGASKKQIAEALGIKMHHVTDAMCRWKSRGLNQRVDNLEERIGYIADVCLALLNEPDATLKQRLKLMRLAANRRAIESRRVQ